MALMYCFPSFEPVHCSTSASNFCLLTCIQISQRQVRWSDIPISFRIFHSFVIHTVKNLSIANKAKVDVFWNSLRFSVIQQMLAV